MEGALLWHISPKMLAHFHLHATRETRCDISNSKCFCRNAIRIIITIGHCTFAFSLRNATGQRIHQHSSHGPAEHISIMKGNYDISVSVDNTGHDMLMISNVDLLIGKWTVDGSISCFYIVSARGRIDFQNCYRSIVIQVSWPVAQICRPVLDNNNVISTSFEMKKNAHATLKISAASELTKRKHEQNRCWEPLRCLLSTN